MKSFSLAPYIRLSRSMKFNYSCDSFLACICALAVLVGWLMGPTPVIHAIPFTDCSGGNYVCYGTGDWYGGTTGTSTEIQVEFVTCGYCSGGVSNETWLVDGSNANCVINNIHVNCEIEAGYATYGPNAFDNKNSCAVNGRVNCYFWADQRYNGGYHEHALGGNIPSGDYGGFVLIEIYFNPGVTDSCASNQKQGHWTVYIGGPSNDHWTQVSTCNPMAVGNSKDYITIGEELHSYGAESPSTTWIDNFWRDNNGNWRDQYRNFDTREQDNPPYSGWIIPPSQSSSGEWNACTQGCFGH